MAPTTGEIGKTAPEVIAGTGFVVEIERSVATRGHVTRSAEYIHQELGD